jgi:head-tail adaptor
MLLTTGDIDWMQDVQEQAMPGTVYILRMGTASNGMGGMTETWGTAGTVIGRVYPRRRLGMGEQVAGGQVVSVSDWFATLPVGTDVIANDRVRYNGRTWEISRVNNDQMWQTAVRCELVSHNEENRV